MPLIIVALGVLFLLILMIGFRLNSFLALILVSIGVGFGLGMPLLDIIHSIKDGVGDTLGHLALVLGFGAMLGKLLADSGAAQRINTELTRIFGVKGIQWAVVLTAFIVGFAMFFEVGFVILIPMVFSLAVANQIPLLYLGIPMAAALSVTHGFLPPHPGPTAIAVIFEADLGLTLLYGAFISVPAILVAGPFFSRFFRKIDRKPPEGLYNPTILNEDEMPGFITSVVTALVPIFLMIVAAIFRILNPDPSEIRVWIDFVGDPVIALLIGVLIAMVSLGIRQGKTMTDIGVTIADSIAGIAMILLIIGAGGGFKQVLVDSGMGDYLTEIFQEYQFPPLILTWMIAALLRISLGSATVAAITTGGLVAPIIGETGVSPELMVLSTGAGSLILSHVNDPGFWMFKEYFNLSLKETFLSWTVLETLISIMGLIGVLILENFV